MLAVALFGAFCTLLAIVLVIAHRLLHVVEDPRIEQVTDMLPGANCGACGLPGCAAFSEAVVKGRMKPADCPVSNAETSAFIANFLGVAVGIIEKKVARLLCAGGRDVAEQVAEYSGFSSCRAAAAAGGGFKGCTWGCLGLADCEQACTFDAIQMGADSLPVVNAEKCTACGDCVRACPKSLFEIWPVSRRLIVRCRSLLAGDEALERCRVACTGCGICAADAPVGLIHIQNNLAVIDGAKTDLESRLATLRCPTGAIAWLDEEPHRDEVTANSAGVS